MSSSEFSSFFVTSELVSRNDAVISDCLKHRYLLRRHVSSGLPQRICLFVMLNPSTADAVKDDPTVRTCIEFARKFECSDMEIVNLFSFRSPSPAEIPKTLDEACGPEWESHLTAAVKRSHLIIAAWGNHGSHLNQDKKVIHFLREYRAMCLGKNKNGSPKHPLYVPRSAELVPL